jgi:uncharacterized protein (TIGR02594 family)
VTPYEIALAELGTLELPGSEDNERIVQYHDYAWTLDANDDETAWCASFVNYCLAKALGCANPRSWKALQLTGAGKANARSLLEWRDACLPERGVVAVLWRGSPKDWRGHVGFVCEPDDGRGNLLMLGGNQSNAVTIQAYPRRRVLAYRRPT